MHVSNEITRVTGGVIVDLPKDWQLESDYTWTRNKAVFGSFGLFFDTIPQGITSGAINPFLDTLANPVDLNYYGGNYLGTSPSQLDNVALRVTGPLGHLPAGSPMLSLGLEYREESMRHASYLWNFANFPSSNLNRQYLPKSQQVLSAYAEMKIPLISKANRVPLVHELDLQLSARTERFDVKTGTTYIETPGAAVVDESVEYSSTNPTIGLRYKPIEQLMFRASYATGFLPPDYSQFLAPTLGGTDTRGPSATVNVIDPLRGNELVATQFISGGNPDIKPQESTSWSLGVVWTPPFLEGLRANLEWYRLELENVATRPTAQQIVTLANQFPNRVQRAAALPGDPYGVGRITLVDFSLLGANRLQTEGFDLSLDYQVPVMDWGTLRLSASGTLIRYFERQASIVAPLQDVTNQIAYDGPLERKGNFGIGWSKDAWKVDWTMSYFGSYEQYAVGGVTAYVQAQGSRTIPSQSYHDVVFTYGWDEDASSSLLSGVTLQFGVNNVFDKVPPLDVFYSSSSYYSPFGDPRLREYRLSLSKRF
ncbi:MAG: TonB-dependent receptor [Steroidobacter sp.]|nr:TonB-dependent receptor [Steroidobacter sp.]